MLRPPNEQTTITCALTVSSTTSNENEKEKSLGIKTRYRLQNVFQRNCTFSRKHYFIMSVHYIHTILKLKRNYDLIR